MTVSVYFPDGQGAYSCGANGTKLWIHRENGLLAISMVHTQRYRSPAFNEFNGHAIKAIGSGD